MLKLATAPRPDRCEFENALRGQYTILETLGGGGMSRVYVAREHALDRVVALKALLPDLRGSREDRERFRREARVLASLRHPGIMPVHSVGEAAGVPYFVMPYIGGATLEERLASGTRFAEAEACEILARLSDAVAASHRLGIVHRDIKPGNVLFENGRPILADFGVATLHTSDHSRSDLARGFGTAAYMAPEQLLGDTDSDERSDIYSLGALAFELLAGRPPFVGAQAQQVAAQHIARSAPSVIAFRPEVSEALDRVILRCLAKRPDDRWASADELRDAVLRVAAARGTRAAASHGWLGAIVRRVRIWDSAVPEANTPLPGAVSSLALK